jgi:hypothetical protein
MSQKIAVAIIHGVGKQDPQFADGMTQELKGRFAKELGQKIQDPAGDVGLFFAGWKGARL